MPRSSHDIFLISNILSIIWLECFIAYGIQVLIWISVFTCSEEIKFSSYELSEIKRVSTGHLRLLGFKPLSCLKDYHNLKPSTFLFPSDEVFTTSQSQSACLLIKISIYCPLLVHLLQHYICSLFSVRAHIYLRFLINICDHFSAWALLGTEFELFWPV